MVYNINKYVYNYICIGYVMPRVLYVVYNHRARGQGDYKPDIAQVDDITNIFQSHVYTA